jgi:hypothetical protein
MDNKELLKKADLALSDLTSGGGLLNPEQSNLFIRKLIIQPNMLNQDVVRFVPMNSFKMNINKINFGKRILRAGTQGTALATAAVTGAFDPSAEATARAKPTFDQVQLSTNLVIAEIDIPYDVMEDNVERAIAADNSAPNTGPGGLRNTILAMIGEAAARDLEELAIKGDTSLVASDPYLGMVDGWLKNGLSNANVVDAQGATISKAIFKAGLKSLPPQYQTNPSTLQNFISQNNKIEYQDTLGQRVGALGDQMTTNGPTSGPAPLYAFDMPVKGVGLMPSDKGILTNPKNLIFGIHRQISLEFDKNIQTQQYIIVLTARVDFKIEEPLAMAVYENIGSA